MGLYLVTLPTTAQHTLKNGVDQMVVAAGSAAAARLAAAAKYTGDSPWSEATVVALADTTQIGTAGALSGWRFKLSVAPVGTYGTVDFELTGGPGTAANDTIDKVGASLVTLLNAHAAVAGATYTPTTQELVIASAGDSLGESSVLLSVMAPAVTGPGGQVNGDDNMAALFIGTLTHQGTAAAATLSMTFAADTTVLPQVLGVGRAK